MNDTSQEKFGLKLGDVIFKKDGISGFRGTDRANGSDWTIWSASKKTRGKLAKWYGTVSRLGEAMVTGSRKSEADGELRVALRSSLGVGLGDYEPPPELRLSSLLYLTYGLVDALTNLSDGGYGLTESMFEDLQIYENEAGVPTLFFPKLRPDFGEERLDEATCCRIVGRFLYYMLTGGVPPTEQVEIEAELGGDRLGAFDSLLLDWVEEHETPTGLGGLAMEAYEHQIDLIAFSKTLFPHLERELSILKERLSNHENLQQELGAEIEGAQERLDDLSMRIEIEEAWLLERAPAIEAAEKAVEDSRQQLRVLEVLDQEIAHQLDVESARTFEERFQEMVHARHTPGEPEHHLKSVQQDGSREIELSPDQFWPDDPKEATRTRPERPLEKAAPEQFVNPETVRLSEKKNGFLKGVFLGVVMASFVGGLVFLIFSQDEMTDRNALTPNVVFSKDAGLPVRAIERPVASATTNGNRAVPDSGESSAAGSRASSTLQTKHDDLHKKATDAAFVMLPDMTLPRFDADTDAQAAVRDGEMPLAGEGLIPPEGMVFIEGGRVNIGLDALAVERIEKVCRRRHGVRSKRCEMIQNERFETNDWREVQSFYLDRTEVDYQQYLMCVAVGSCVKPDHNWNKAGYPVTGVTSAHAAQYCRWRNARLPHRFEWMFAVRGNSTDEIYPWGSRWRKLNGKSPANTGEWSDRPIVDETDGYRYVAPVNSFGHAATAVGVRNLAGNVREFVRVDEGVGLVGGGYLSLPFEARVTRLETATTNRSATDIGFRCAQRVGR